MLGALGDVDDAGVGPVAVHEGAELPHRLAVLDRLLPFAGVRVDDQGHLGVQLGADPQRVVDDHAAQVVEAALEVVEPAGRALQPIGGAHVEHQEPVDVLDQRRLVEVGGEQQRVLRLHAAVAAQIEVVALLGGDDAEVLALCLGAFARTARHGRLQLVRRAAALVAILDPDRQADGESCTPKRHQRAADARLHGCAAPCRRRAPTSKPGVRDELAPGSQAAARGARPACRSAARR